MPGFTRRIINASWCAASACTPGYTEINVMRRTYLRPFLTYRVSEKLMEPNDLLRSRIDHQLVASLFKPILFFFPLRLLEFNLSRSYRDFCSIGPSLLHILKNSPKTSFLRFFLFREEFYFFLLYSNPAFSFFFFFEEGGRKARVVSIGEQWNRFVPWREETSVFPWAFFGGRNSAIRGLEA